MKDNREANSSWFDYFIGAALIYGAILVSVVFAASLIGITQAENDLYMCDPLIRSRDGQFLMTPDFNAYHRCLSLPAEHP